MGLTQTRPEPDHSAQTGRERRQARAAMPASRRSPRECSQLLSFAHASYVPLQIRSSVKYRNDSC